MGKADGEFAHFEDLQNDVSVIQVTTDTVDLTRKLEGIGIDTETALHPSATHWRECLEGKKRSVDMPVSGRQRGSRSNGQRPLWFHCAPSTGPIPRMGRPAHRSVNEAPPKIRWRSESVTRRPEVLTLAVTAQGNLGWVLQPSSGSLGPLDRVHGAPYTDRNFLKERGEPDV